MNFLVVMIEHIFIQPGILRCQGKKSVLVAFDSKLLRKSHCNCFSTTSESARDGYHIILHSLLPPAAMLLIWHMPFQAFSTKKGAAYNTKLYATPLSPFANG